MTVDGAWPEWTRWIDIWIDTSSEEARVELWNDEPGRTRDEVVDMLEAAAWGYDK